MRRTSVVLAVLAFAGLVAPAGASTAGATTRSPRIEALARSFAHSTRFHRIGNHAAPAPLRRALGAGRDASSLCTQQSYGDPYGDAGALDASAYAIGLDCTNHVWAVIATDPTGVPPWAFGPDGFFGLALDLDNNLGTGCDGADRLVIGFTDGFGFYAAVGDTVGCVSVNPRSDPVDATQVNDTTMGIAFYDSLVGKHGFGWSLVFFDFLGIGDFMPDTGEHFAAPPAPHAPGTPVGVRATPGDGRLSVSFTSPPDGGAAITAYAAECTPSTGGTPVTQSRAHSPVVVTGLTNGRPYRCRVRAFNRLGGGTWSNSTAPIAPGRLPGAATITAVTAHHGRVEVEFAMLDDIGAPPASTFRARCADTDLGISAAVTTTSSSPAVVTNLNDGTAYRCSVQASNSIGDGPWSSESDVVVPEVEVPDTPTAVHAVAGDGEATVYFTPGNDGGSPVSAFSVIAEPGGVTLDVTESPAVVTGLDNGTAYRFRVQATSAIGSSAPSAASDPVVPVGFGSQGSITFAPAATRSVAATQQPLAGDFNGDGISDLVWYAPGAGADSMWLGTRVGFTPGPPVNVSAAYLPIVGDFDGDGTDDIMWYAPGAAPDRIWRGSAFGFTNWMPVNIAAVYRPIAGDFDGDGRTDIFWDAPGTATDRFWYGTSTGFRTAARASQYHGRAAAVVVDANHDGRDDVLWYSAGSAPELLWTGHGRSRNSTFSATSFPSVSGTYTTVAGDFNADGRSDLLWYAPGPAADAVWIGAGTAFATRVPLTVNGRYQPVAGDFDGDGRSDVLWYAPGSTPESIWFGR